MKAGVAPGPRELQKEVEMLLHPAFDTKTNTWFVDDYEVPTLRELKKQVGPDVEFLDYYPMGLSKAINIQWAKKESRRRPGFTLGPIVSRRSRIEGTLLRIAVIKLLEAGRTTKEISTELHCSCDSVSGIKTRWLKKGAINEPAQGRCWLDCSG